MRPCRIEMSPALVAALCVLFYLDPGGIFFSLLSAAVLHEAGHLLVLRLLGVKILRLRLCLNGAVLATEPLTYRHELFAAAAGPLSNALLGAIFLRACPIFAALNFGLMAYNLLPLYPLDGGRILRAIVYPLFGETAGRRMEQGVGATSLLALGAGAVWLTCWVHLGLWPILLFALLLMRIAGEKEKFHLSVDKRFGM